MFSHSERTTIKTVWYHAELDQFTNSQLQYVADVQNRSGGIFYTVENVAEILAHSFNAKTIILLKYEIPATEQEKITNLYYLSKRIHFENSGVQSNIFCAACDINPVEIINFDYYTGFCIYSSEKNTYQFHPCDPVAKTKWLNEHIIESSSNSSTFCHIF